MTTMKKYALAAIAALTLTACAGLPGGDRCTQAQAVLAKAQAAVIAYQTQFPDKPLPQQLLDALTYANAAMPIFCPAPALVISE
jgi:PBP1b-binding outer membrane lipoprotein LpoB